MKLRKLSAVLATMLCMCNLSALQGSAVNISVGDTNADGIVNAVDASAILTRCAEIGSGYSATEEEFAVMDIDNDGRIGANDAGIVLQYSANTGVKVMADFTEYVAQRLEQPVFYNAQYIRHDGAEYYDGENNFVYHVIKSYEELENFLAKTCESAWNDSAISELENTLNAYNTAFFETNDLIVVCVEEPSGSIRHEVKDITADENNNWTVAINKISPLIGTCDMAPWAIFVETNKAVEFASSLKIDWTETCPDDVNTAVELSKDIQSETITGKEADEAFINGQTKFALDLFRNAVHKSGADENIMISSYSVVQALGMTANGADGNTKTQMEQLIGGMPMEELNQYLYTQRISQPDDEKCKLNTANSIWVRDDAERIQVKEDFLQTNADYYNASVFKAPFDNSTVTDMNNWVKKNTDDMIPELLNEIPDIAVMYLINAVVFDGKWQTPYTDYDVRERIFTACDGSEQTVEMMNSTEYYYLEDENTTGFYKYYQGGRYAFAALLPDEDISMTDYIDSLTTESLQNLLANPEVTSVQTVLPKFSYDYEIELSDTLSDMGMPDAFSENADFSRMAETASGYLGISKVLHKTHIDVFEEGTKAAAVTGVMMNDCTAILLPEKSVVLDRPFVYSIVDTETNLPVFIGVLNSVE